MTDKLFVKLHKKKYLMHTVSLSAFATGRNKQADSTYAFYLELITQINTMLQGPINECTFMATVMNCF